MWFPQPASWWPGLLRLWKRGDLVSLGLAALFAALVNLALLATWVWPEAVPAAYRLLLWTAVIGLWSGGIYSDYRRFRRPAATGPPSEDVRSDDPYCAALRAYLVGDWTDAERQVMALIKANPYDMEARLLWATLLRHSGRHRSARRQLRRLERFEAAGKWSWEISREWEMLQRGKNFPAEVSHERDGDGSRLSSCGEQPFRQASGSVEETYHSRKAA